MPERHPIGAAGLPPHRYSRAGHRFLVCPPTYFDVSYAINPWMHPGIAVDLDRARAQWQSLVSTLVGLGHTVEQMQPQPELPDLVFAANGGIAIGGRALAPKFRFAQRSAESDYFAAALAELGYEPVGRPEHLNEGEGDFLMVGNLILAGHGFRSDLAATVEVERYFGIPVIDLTLVDERFYHLDTALAVLDETTVAYYPGAFDERSNRLLTARFPDAILAEEADAAVLGLNMVSDGTDVVLCAPASRLRGQLLARGYRVHPIEFDEFGKAGGGPKCCVLRLQERPTPAGDHTGPSSTTQAATTDPAAPTTAATHPAAPTTATEDTATGAPTAREEAAVELRCYADGPVLVRGDFALLDRDGAPVPRTSSTIALCRCGFSSLKPYCDGSHKGSRFSDRPPGAGATRPESGPREE